MRCSHAAAVPVYSAVTGELVAALCPECDQQLSAEFLGCVHANIIDTPALGEQPGRGICNDCGTSAWFDRPPALITCRTDVNTEDLEARLRAVRADPYRTLYLPSVSTPTYADLDDIPNSWL